MSRIIVLSLLAIVAVTFSKSANIPGDKLGGAGSDGAVNFRARRESLPGRYTTPEQQCRDRKSGYFVTICTPEYPELLCEDLHCTSNRGDIPSGEESGPALDGTWCGDNKMCLGGSCVYDPESLESPLKIVESEQCM